MNTTVQMWMVANTSKFDSKDLPQVTKALEEADESKAGLLMPLQLKSPGVGLLLTLFLGQLGVGVAYAGYKIRAVICLVLWIVGIVGWVLGQSGMPREGALMMMALGPAVWMVLFDLLSIWGEIKRENMKKFCTVMGVELDPSLKKRMREHVIGYWILFALLGGLSLFGMHGIGNEMAAQEQRRREASLRLQEMSERSRQIQENLKDFERAERDLRKNHPDLMKKMGLQ